MTTWYEDGRHGLKAGILINPLGGKNKTCANELFSIAKKFLDLVVWVTTPEEIKGALARMSENEIDILIISGGDGTVQATLTGLFSQGPFDRLPRIAILPGGTTNLIASDIGIKGSQKKALKRLHRLILDNSLHSHTSLAKRHVIRLGYLNKIEEYGMFLGAGGIYHAVAMCQKHSTLPLLKRKAMIFSSGLEILMTGLGSKQDPDNMSKMKIIVDGRPIPEEDFLLVLSTTLERLFLGLQPFWATDKGPIHLTAVRKRPKKLLSVLLQMFFDRFSPVLAEKNGYYSFNADRIEIYTHTGIALDGQIFQADPGPARPFIIEDAGQIITMSW